MTIRNVLVHVDNSFACKARVDAALDLAERFGATLTGYYARPQLSVLALADAGGATLVYQQALDELQQDADNATREFEAQTGAKDVTSAWETDDRPLFEGLVTAARYHDLVVLGQHDPNDPRCTSQGLAAHVALTAGVPAIVIPPTSVAPTFGLRAVVAWSGTRESTRALHDALPFLVTAQEVHVLALDGSDLALQKVSKQLAGHGISAQTHLRDSEGEEIGERLLLETEALGGDLIVLGAYGHSRMREFVLGGVTRTLLLDAQVPLLLSH